MTRTTVFGLTLSEADGSFRLGTDALLLSAFIRENKKAWALEMGAGSGAVSLLLAKRGCFKKIHAIEIQSELYQTMVKNVDDNALDGIITPIRADVRELDPEEFKGVSVIYANPPYMKADSGKSSPSEMRHAARHEVYGGVYDFCRAASKILKTGGRLYLVYRPDRLETLMRSLYENGFSPKRMTFVHSDAVHSPSSVLIEAVLDGKEALTLTCPFFFNENGRQSPDAEHVYANGRFPEKYQTD